MKSLRLLPAAAILLLVAGCAETEESQVEALVEELVDGLNAADSAAIGRLFVDGLLYPVNSAGDSSVVYRLVTTPGGTDYSADGITSMIFEGKRAHAEFELTASVKRNDDVMGRMLMRIGLDLERERGSDVWRILPGSDRMLSTY